MPLSHTITTNFGRGSTSLVVGSYSRFEQVTEWWGIKISHT